MTKTAQAFLEFVNKSPSPFHAVKEAADRLTAAGFIKLQETSDWKNTIQPNGKYFVTRNQSAIVRQFFFSTEISLIFRRLHLPLVENINLVMGIILLVLIPTVRV